MIATIISRLFDPFLMLGVVFILMLWDSPVFIPAFFTVVILPFLLFVLAWKTKCISNWDVSDRKERPKILWTLVGIEMVCATIFQLSSIIPILATLVGFSLISHFWKISGHAMATALTSGLIVVQYGWSWWPVVFTVPLVGWARIATKNHTILQVVAGAVLSWSIIFFYETWQSIF